MSLKYNVLVIPVASQMVNLSHVSELEEELLSRLVSSNKYTNIDVISQIMNEKNWEEVTSEVNKIIDNYDGLIIAHLTGGTSRIVLEFLTDLENVKPFALFALSRYNSLPSALNTRERIIQFLSKEIHIPIIYEKYELDELFRYFYVVDKVLQKYNILFIAPTMGVKVQPNFRLIRPTRLSKVVKDISEEQISIVLERSKNYVKLNYNGSVEEKLAISLYQNLKSMINNSSSSYEKSGIKGFACLDCYYIMRRRKVAPCLAVSMLLGEGYLIACQRDLSSLFAMLLLKLLTGQPSWIADVSILNRENNSLILSHSCFNLTMSNKAEATLHPLTKLPYAIRAEINPGKKVTLLTIDPVNEEFDVEIGEIINLSKYRKDLEATQIEVRLISTHVDDFLRKSHRGHYIVTWGDWRRDLENINNLIIQVKTIRALKGK